MRKKGRKKSGEEIEEGRLHPEIIHDEIDLNCTQDALKSRKFSGRLPVPPFRPLLENLDPPMFRGERTKLCMNRGRGWGGGAMREAWDDESQVHSANVLFTGVTRRLLGFFRRSIQKQIEYRCLRDGKCLVIRLNRNRCQYCRFKKCLAVGMSRDSVRYGRVPKRSRERGEGSDVRVTTSDSSSDQSCDIDNKHLAIYDVILTVSQAYQSNCDYTEEQTKTLTRKPLVSHPSPVCSSPEVASSTADSNSKQRIWLWQQFATHMTPSVQRVVEFAKRVPGFCDLSQDDQLILIKVGFFELWLGHVSRLTSECSLTFSDGTYVTRQQMELMYDSEFVYSIFHFANSFNALALNDTELGLFSAVVLLTSDRPGVTDLKAIKQHQDRLLDALKLQVGRNHANEPQVLSNVLLKLPELRNLGAKHSAHLDWFRLNWDKLRLPPLFAEIFDIPKCEEDLQ
ncbi:unnamed protein product [Bemisia tabaci]|uniref:Ecdysone-induced protein 78C n=1 Tax=Bemisia tabaci TaxID=7038 RepID=A0A9P0F5K5_BEMTA|nr:unnamed protein product [Bemisia tabaci]